MKINKNLINVPMTYKQLCNNLGLKYTTGNSKNSQLKELYSYCDYQKNGTRYIITKIFDEPKQIKDARMTTAPKIELILMSELSQIKGSLFATNKELLRLCYIINNNYYDVLSNKDKNSIILSEKYNFDDSFFKYIDRAYDILKPTLISALNSMSKRKEINISTGYRIKRKDGSILCVSVSPNDDIGKKIFEIQGDALVELNMRSFNDFYSDKNPHKIRLKEYYDLCNDKLKQECQNNEYWIRNGWTDFVSFYQCYAITLNHNKIKYDLEKELKAKSDLNEMIKDKLHTTKRLQDMAYNDIDKWFIVFNTTKGDYKYNFAEDIKEYYKSLDKC